MQKLTTENKEQKLTLHGLERRSAIHKNTAGRSSSKLQANSDDVLRDWQRRPPSGAATGHAHTSAGSSSGPTWRTRRHPPPRPPSPRTSSWPQAETITTVTYASRPTTHDAPALSAGGGEERRSCEQSRGRRDGARGGGEGAAGGTETPRRFH